MFKDTWDVDGLDYAMLALWQDDCHIQHYGRQALYLLSEQTKAACKQLQAAFNP